MKDKYRKTVYACFAGYIVQAIVNNFVPLLFLTFEKSYHIPLSQITMLITFNFGIQLLIDLLSAKFVDRIGYRISIVLAHVFSAAGLICLVILPDLLPNAFAGLLINMQRPFKVGDWVGMDGAYGTILKISWMTTAIKSTSGQEVYVPNQIIYSNIFTNYSTFNKRCITLHSSVPFASDLEHVKTVVLDEVNKVTGVLKDDGIDFFYTEIGDTAFNFEISFWIKFSIERDYQQAMSDIIISIKNRFEKENIQIV